ncbi:MAG: hypothetical protein A2Z99_11345 [Treponema sp. GWB1_62_6]|nr:MAG: hypothetical protein A2Y36_11080 [Treponema sp. GWA1_62_8]OHE66951.1 MAG: hypothetical protein A2001_07830 [Treponema sp. GWC1_61_84]OHE70097.1 MAG: hypothetical protein A2Z99_11345 [Treponema sp. GWB1_62_6]OHE71605.1 MAG: hypothetical protein A2413_14710 [Treponema sp. RIFOXYC1_FULL_61_9]HCM25500.1 hypothetical protein [Treponema sp.]
MNEIVPTNTLAKQGVAAVGGIAGGLGLLVLGGLPWIFGIVAGGVVAVVGLSAMASHERADRIAGRIALGAGALAVLAKLPIVGGLAGGLFGLATFGLLGMGVWNGFKFMKGLKSRA